MTPGDDALCVFAVKRGKIDGRFDSSYNHPKYRIAIEKMTASVKMIPFDEIIASISGGATPLRANEEQYLDRGIKFLRIQNITPMGFDFSDVKFITEDVHNGLLKRSQLADRDLLMTITGRIGTCAVISKKDLPANINQHIVRIRLKDGNDPYFISSYLNSGIGMLLSNRGVTGTTRIALDYESIKRIPIPVVSKTKMDLLLEFQKDSVGTYNNRLQQANDLLSSMDKFVLDKLGIEIPKYNEQLVCAVKITDIRVDKTMDAGYYHPERMATIHMMHQSHSGMVQRLNDVVNFQRDTASSADGAQKYLGLAGVQANTGELSGTDEEANGQAFKYTKNDVLYGRLRPYLNKVLLAEKDGICSTEFHVMRVKKGVDLIPGYLAAIMRSSLIFTQTKHMMTGNTHPRISNDDVKNLYIPVPDIGIQKMIADEVIKCRYDARRIKLQAEQDWTAAKEQFEKELLGG